MSRAPAAFSHVPPLPRRAAGPVADLLPGLSRGAAQPQRRPASAGGAGFPLSRLAAQPAPGPVVQRVCAECAAEDRTPVQPRLEVGPADDRYEREADRVASAVMRMPDAPADPMPASPAPRAPQRACCASCECGGGGRHDQLQSPSTARDTYEKVKPLRVQREVEPEEEMLQTRRIQREVEPEEDMLQTRRIQREVEPEEEMLQTRRIQREVEPEEEMLQTRRIQREVEPEEEMIQTRRVQREVEPEEEMLQTRRVQRETEPEEESVQARRQPETDAATPTLAASSAELTSGGSEMPEHLRAFYEPRLGRDLSSVRLHTGAGAAQKNKSIGARAFTYGSHIWLGGSEPVAPSFTMSHELAHVMQQTKVPRLKTETAPEQTRDPNPAPRRIQRKKEAVWMPESHPVFGNDPARKHAEAHDHVVDLLGKANSGLITEAPVPGGASWQVDFITGFADLYRAKPLNTIGVTVTRTPKGKKRKIKNPKRVAYDSLVDARNAERKKAGARKMSVKERNAYMKKQGFKKLPSLHRYEQDAEYGLGNDNSADWAGNRRGTRPKIGGADHMHNRDGRPHVSPNAQEGQDLDETNAPENIEFGDVKPGYFGYVRDKLATNQIKRYQYKTNRLAGIVKDAFPNSSWTPDPQVMQDGVKIPSGYKPNSRAGGETRKGVLYADSGAVKRDRKIQPNPSVDVRLMIGRSSKGNGTWVFFWAPQGKVQFGGIEEADRAEYEQLNKDYTTLVKELQSSPLKENRKPRRLPLARHAGSPARPQRKMRTGVPVPGAVTRAPSRHVRRRKVNKDGFNLTTWTRKQKAVSKDFKRFAKRNPKSAAALARNEAILEADQHLADNLKDYAPQQKKNKSRAAQQTRRYAKMRIMTGPRGRVIGRIRKIFGRAFVRVADAYQKITKRFKKRMKAPRGLSSGIEGAAVKAMLNVLKIGAGVVLQRSVGILVQRMEQCISSQVEAVFGKLVGDAPLASFEDQFARLESAKADLEEVANSTSSELARKFLGPYDGLFTGLGVVLKGVTAITSVIALVKWGARIAACGAPPLVGCLWNLAAGALELAASRIVASCWFLKKMMPHAMKLSFFKTLPGQLADGLQKGIGAVLPKALQPYICAKGTDREIAKVAPPQLHELTCEDGRKQPKVPDWVIERFEELTALDEDKMKVLLAWMRRNKLPRNTKIDYKKFFAFVEEVQKSKLSADQLEEALRKSEEAEADPSARQIRLSEFAEDMLERGETTRKRNRRRAAARKRKAEAAAAVGSEKGGGTGEKGRAAKSGSGGRGDEKTGDSTTDPALKTAIAMPAPKTMPEIETGKFFFLIVQMSPDGSAPVKDKAYTVRIRTVWNGKVYDVPDLQIIYETSRTVMREQKPRTLWEFHFKESYYVKSIDLHILGGPGRTLTYVF